jgi:heat shock protein HtpX
MVTYRTIGTRLLLAVTGVAMLVVYVATALVGYRFLLALWARRPDPVCTALVVVAVSLSLGYASYRVGTARIIHALDAVELPRDASPRFHDRVGALAAEMAVEPPALLVGNLGSPNALALGGPGNGRVVLDVTLFRLLGPDELSAVVAHEMAHIAARDSLTKTLGYSLVQTAGGLLALVFLPVALLLGGVARAASYLRGDHPVAADRVARGVVAAVASLGTVLLLGLVLPLQAYARRREFAADERAAAVTGRPLALARGLARIERAATPEGPFSSLYIHGDEEVRLTRLLASHPPMAERIERLVDSAGTPPRRGGPLDRF